MEITLTVKALPSSTGPSPLEEALLELEHASPHLRSAAEAAIEKLQYKAMHTGDLLVHVKNNLWYLNIHSRNLNGLIFFFWAGSTIHLLNGYVNKAEKLGRRYQTEVKKAKALMTNGFGMNYA